jgi:hypothetical protein
MTKPEITKNYPNAKIAISEKRAERRKSRQEIAVGITEMAQHDHACGDTAHDLNGLKPFHTVRRLAAGVFE